MWLVAWTKVDQTDFYALCVIDVTLAEEVKQMATSEGKHFRDILRSAIQQRRYRGNSPLKKYWERLTPQERSARGSSASQKRWKAEKPAAAKTATAKSGS